MDSTQQFHKTRLAPTPSGFLHLGNVLSFAITAALAKKAEANILLRIDDLDRGRVNSLYVQDIFDTLDFLEISWHEGPRDYNEYQKDWSQIHRMPMYLDALQKLKDANAVFACTCSRTQLSGAKSACACLQKTIGFNEANVTWRLKTDFDKNLKVHLLNRENINTCLPAAMQHFVVRKKDGYPAYQLTSVLDDVFYGIDVVVRGQDLWESTLAQHYLARHIGVSAFNDITFYHHQLLMSSGGGKLSKSAGATSVNFLRNEGKKQGDIYTLIAGMSGYKIPVKDWEELAALVMPKI